MSNVYRFERRAAVLSLTVSFILLGVKFTAYWLTGSAAVFSDALESIVNVLASGLALYSIILAHAPADAKHPYGHGKVEFLSAAFEGGMILLAALVITVRAIEQFIRGSPVQQLEAGLALSIGAMLVNGMVGLGLVSAGRRHGSIALEADGKHLLGDAVTTLAVVLALAGVKLTGLAWLDPLGAIVVAFYISTLAVGLLRRATAGLMDEQDVGDDRIIRRILDAHLPPGGAEPRICSYHKLRHRHSGRYHWVDFHIFVPAGWTIEQGHRVASALEYEIERALGQGDATAHVEPCAGAACETCDQPAGGGEGVRR